MIRYLKRHIVYIDRNRLRRMRRGETIRISGLPPGAVMSARVQCHRVGRERECYYSLSARQVREEIYEVEITRMTIEDAIALGLLRRKLSEGDEAEDKK